LLVKPQEAQTALKIPGGLLDVAMGGEGKRELYNFKVKEQKQQVFGGSTLI